MESGLNAIFKLSYLRETQQQEQRENREKVLKSLQHLKIIKSRTFSQSFALA